MEYIEKAELLDEHAKITYNHDRVEATLMVNVSAPFFHDRMVAERKHVDTKPFIIYETEVMRWLEEHIGHALSIKPPGGKHLRNDLLDEWGRRTASAEFSFTLNPLHDASIKALKSSELHITVVSSPPPLTGGGNLLPPASPALEIPHPQKNSSKKRRSRKAKSKSEG